MANAQFPNHVMSALIYALVQPDSVVHIQYAISTDSFFARWKKRGVWHEIEYAADESYLHSADFVEARRKQLESRVNVAEVPI